jgi:hypothetical protein
VTAETIHGDRSFLEIISFLRFTGIFRSSPKEADTKYHTRIIFCFCVWVNESPVADDQKEGDGFSNLTQLTISTGSFFC